jgi:NADH-quinone oxidoreductase subunit I
VSYPVPEDRPQSLRESLYLPELLHGLGVTAAHFFRNLFMRRDPNPDILARQGPNQISTVEYPEERVHYPVGYRGLHRLVPREDGKPRCVACYMCATVCPAECIYIEAGEYPDDPANPASAAIEKFPTKFVIDELRCVVCGFCVEACPKDAIRMDTGIHTPAHQERDGFVWDIPKLLKGPAVDIDSDPWHKRDRSERPEHLAPETHARVGDGMNLKRSH